MLRRLSLSLVHTTHARNTNTRSCFLSLPALTYKTPPLTIYSLSLCISGNSSKKLTSDRGFCGHCNAVVWLNNLKCSNVHSGLKSQNQQIKLISPSQVVEYLLDDCSSMISSSDSDSESDEESISSLWAYPKHLQL
ncbi:hypothetical protein Pint_17574 [Pistacia integerrima]|uniref:Uncharacterized protein n=1 Tax=Pistacia integerrima TaxID=434235 RepID=A0ACC0YYY0_9ROSI|nr:hypothetical protein Pint_17574 [Pistacia integerrima]